MGLLLYDNRSDELHLLRVPSSFFAENISKFAVRVEKAVISLELSAQASSLFRDFRPGGRGLHFAPFKFI